MFQLHGEVAHDVGRRSLRAEQLGDLVLRNLGLLASHRLLFLMVLDEHIERLKVLVQTHIQQSLTGCPQPDSARVRELIAVGLFAEEDGRKMSVYAVCEPILLPPKQPATQASVD